MTRHDVKWRGLEFVNPPELMRPYRSLTDPANVDELLRRLAEVRPISPRQWGTMTPHEMVCHLGDSFQSVLGERRASAVDTWFSRNILKWVAINTSIPWPQGV